MNIEHPKSPATPSSDSLSSDASAEHEENAAASVETAVEAPDKAGEVNPDSQAEEERAAMAESQEMELDFLTDVEVGPEEKKNLFEGPWKVFTVDPETGVETLDVEATRENQKKHLETFLDKGQDEWEKAVRASVIGNEYGDSVFANQSFEDSTGFDAPTEMERKNLPFAVGDIKRDLLILAAHKITAIRNRERAVEGFSWFSRQDVPKGMEDRAGDLLQTMEGHQRKIDDLQKEVKVLRERANETPAEQWSQVTDVDNKQRTEVWNSLSPELQDQIQKKA